MSDELIVDPGAPRQQVREKYREVATEPDTGSPPEALRDIDLWTA